jgi:hypothetical protein
MSRARCLGYSQAHHADNTHMTNPWRGKSASPLGDFATSILDPVLKRKAGMSTALVQSWEEIVGARLSTRCRPERIAWPRRAGEDDPFQPATLIIACEGSAALHLQHETGEIINRINAFLGFTAIAQIRIVQKPVNILSKMRPQPPRPTQAQKEHVAGMVRAVDDDGLRASLERLGQSIAASRAGKTGSRPPK